MDILNMLKGYVCLKLKLILIFFNVVVRMSESLYNVKQLGKNCEKVDDLSRVFDLESICRPRQIQQAVHFGTSTKNYQVSSTGTESGTSVDMTLADNCMYVDSDISDELRLKVIYLIGCFQLVGQIVVFSVSLFK